MIQRMAKARKANAALIHLHELHASIFDLQLHLPQNHEKLEQVNVSDQYNKIWNDLTGIDSPEVFGKR